MKREIEFRGQRADNKEWVYGDLVRIPNGDSFECYIISDFDERDSIYDLWKYAIKVIPETVGQYVGITDKNGKKVYKGDVVKFEHPAYREKSVGFVDWEGNETGFVMRNKNGYETFAYLEEFYEVIGNIFDRESDNGD